ncbi:hypothetical protein [Streptomyces sp. UNOC14_S4]|uniref:hypothetical protein n=1 Tax=Streptomyces sp. UNOC14_S4 TaxID=2872340 RepID=UPI001E4346FF|nr:hypothetical protein [Streptomyces sp. UNOC14_S4]MCC3766698.1 hypothetical protein [Streptomyces sp. UNOC14_S4]
MDLTFIGIDPETTGGGSPTAWVDEDTADLVIQGEEADQSLKSQISETEWVPGHDRGIPQHENVIRIPARMVPILRRACDVAEQRARLRRAAPRGSADGCPPGDA